MSARAVALVKFFFVVSITSKPLPSRLHLLTVPLAELIQYNLLAGKSIERPKAGFLKVRIRICMTLQIFRRLCNREICELMCVNMCVLCLDGNCFMQHYVSLCDKTTS